MLIRCAAESPRVGHPDNPFPVSNAGRRVWKQGWLIARRDDPTQIPAGADRDYFGALDVGGT